MSISCAPVSSAASRATLPWLCPCRTSQSRSGQFCRLVDINGRKLQRSNCAVSLGLLGRNRCRLRPLPLSPLVHPPERRQRLADDLVHVVIAVSCKASDEGYPLGRVGKRFILLIQRLV